MALVGLASYPSVHQDYRVGQGSRLGTAMTKRFFKSYNDVPDGSQCHRKAYITIALGSHCGKIGSTYSVTHSPADSALEAVTRVGHIHCSCCWSKVWSYHLCQCQVQEKPDDPLNYFIGGCAGGLTLGTSAPTVMGLQLWALCTWALWPPCSRLASWKAGSCLLNPKCEPTPCSK